MKNITLLGATGSIGKSTLSVIDLHPDKFNVFALSAHTNWQKMIKLCNKYQPRFAVMSDEDAADSLAKVIKGDTKVMAGVKELDVIAAHQETDYVMAAIVGSAGMHSTLAAARAGKRIMLANKESLVLAGDILMDEINHAGAELIPVDSEHSAIFQCLQNNRIGLRKVQLTASGGPFLNRPINTLKLVTPDDACAHPNWGMGRKISVDSATMMNKGLEVIEAFYLFSLTPQQIDVVVHPQSVVHSSVYYEDGSTLAQLGKPDMRTAIAYAMSYPDRMESGVGMVDLTDYSPLTFYQPDLNKFSCLRLAFESLKKGGSAIATVNVANEVAVEHFLAQQIKFVDIPKVIEQTLNSVKHTVFESLKQVMENDYITRLTAKEIAQHYL